VVVIATVAGSSLQYRAEADVVVQHLAEKYRSTFETKNSAPEVYQLPSRRLRKSSHADLQKWECRLEAALTILQKRMVALLRFEEIRTPLELQVQEALHQRY
jgi:hypothetical protein